MFQFIEDRFKNTKTSNDYRRINIKAGIVCDATIKINSSLQEQIFNLI